jgi:general secretion pathway protein G
MLVRTNKAFTLIEMMVVFVLISIILAFVGPRVRDYFRQAGKIETKFRFERIKDALLDYKMTFGMYPTTRETLSALVANPHPNAEAFKRNADKWPFAGLKEEDIADKAGNPYIYNCPPVKYKNQYRSFELIFLGPTQTEGDPEGHVDGV